MTTEPDDLEDIDDVLQWLETEGFDKAVEIIKGLEERRDVELGAAEQQVKDLEAELDKLKATYKTLIDEVLEHNLSTTKAYELANEIFRKELMK